MKKQSAWLLFVCLLAGMPASAQVVEATVKIDGMI